MCAHPAIEIFDNDDIVDKFLQETHFYVVNPSSARHSNTIKNNMNMRILILAITLNKG